MLLRFVFKILTTAIAALCAAYLLQGIQIHSLRSAIILAIVLGLLNTFIKPLLILFTLPITVLTLGLFLLVINIIIVKWAAVLVPGFYVQGWWSALLFSIIVSVISYVLNSIAGKSD